MQTLRRTLSKRGRSKSKDRPTGAGVATQSTGESVAIAGELSSSPEEIRSGLFTRGRKTSLPTPPIDRGLFLPPQPSMTQINEEKA